MINHTWVKKHAKSSFQTKPNSVEAQTAFLVSKYIITFVILIASESTDLWFLKFIFYHHAQSQ